MNTTRRTVLGFFGSCLATGTLPAGAQSFPTRPVQLVVPFPPGGPTDVVGRLLAERLGHVLGQPIVVENKAGAGGTIGSAAVAKAPADGYTLLYGSTSTLGISPVVYKNLPYDPHKAFAPVALVSRTHQVLVAHPQLPVTSFAELVEYSKRNPDKVSYASPGNGTPGHVSGELLKQMTGLKALHVPFKGGAPSLQSVVAGETQFTVDVVPTSLQYLRAGRLKALAILSPRRSDALPDVPTVKEAGFNEVDADSWTGLVAPAGTPSAVVARLNAEIRKVISEGPFKERLISMGAIPQTTSPEEFGAFISAELRKWAAVAKAADLQVT